MSGRDVHQEQLEYIMGEDGTCTEAAIFDPSGIALAIYGIFDNVTFRSTDKDGNGSAKKNTTAVFTVASAPDFNVYDRVKLHLTERGTTMTVEYIDRDKTGVQRIWLS